MSGCVWLLTCLTVQPPLTLKSLLSVRLLIETWILSDLRRPPGVPGSSFTAPDISALPALTVKVMSRPGEERAVPGRRCVPVPMTRQKVVWMSASSDPTAQGGVDTNPMRLYYLWHFFFLNDVQLFPRVVLRAV